MEPIDKLVKLVDELTGSCPYDVFEWQVKGSCEKMCGIEGRGYNETRILCWKEWAQDNEQN